MDSAFTVGAKTSAHLDRKLGNAFDIPRGPPSGSELAGFDEYASMELRFAFGGGDACRSELCQT
jgi:hypothetical protein